MTAVGAGDGVEPDFDALVRQFEETEQALRSILMSSEKLSSATESLAEARSAIEDNTRSAAARLEEASTTVEAAEKHLQDVASGIYGLTTELKDVARNLKDTAVGFRALDPAALREDISRLEGRMKALPIVALISAVAGVAAFAATIAA